MRDLDAGDWGARCGRAGGDTGGGGGGFIEVMFDRAGGALFGARFWPSIVIKVVSEGGWIMMGLATKGTEARQP